MMQGKPPCGVCRVATALYQCPRCAVLTCSLKCCKAHKTRDKCSGKRPLTSAGTMAELTDLDIRRDYHFLEDVCQSMESTKKLVNPNKKRRKWIVEESSSSASTHTLLRSPQPNTLVQTNQSKLQQHALKRGIRLHQMPPFMERHKRNKSGLRKNRELHWTVDWTLVATSSVGPPKTQSSLVPETKSIRDALRDCIVDDALLIEYVCRIQKIPGRASSPKYIGLDMNASLGDALRGQTILEFPTIYIVPVKRQADFPLLLQEMDDEEQVENG